MAFVSDKKRYLVATEIVAIVTLAVCVLFMRAESDLSLISWQAIGSFISGIIFLLAFFPLCYSAWFSHAEKTTAYYFKQAFFWLLLVSLACIVIYIGGMFFEK